MSFLVELKELLNTLLNTLKELLNTFWKLEIPMMLLLIFSLFTLGQKKLKTCNVKKYNSKCAKFTIKN